jgi:hypothetical protein
VDIAPAEVQRLSIPTADKGLNATRDFKPSQLSLYQTKKLILKARIALIRRTIHLLILIFWRYVVVAMQGGLNLDPC